MKDWDEVEDQSINSDSDSDESEDDDNESKNESSNDSLSDDSNEKVNLGDVKKYYELREKEILEGVELKQMIEKEEKKWTSGLKKVMKKKVEKLQKIKINCDEDNEEEKKK